MLFLSLLLTFCTKTVFSESTSSPHVTLSHGGTLTGLSTSFQGVNVDVFLGIRYAKPPTGSLRFKKSEIYPAWEGVKEATRVGDKCPQLGPGGFDGSEDCLYIDITVPRQGKSTDKKAVMVWIHGGAFSFGVGSAYIGTPLAVFGDVIVVTFNYRIGMLGFLYDGPGTGNFGLWDQRTALLWVKENIEQFGGDPDRITIFGESAGGGSVSAQMMGQHNDGLFSRAITQSGTLYQMLPMMKSKLKAMVKSIREQTGCTSPGKVYECLADKSAVELLTTISLDPTENYWHPISDNDFFGSDVEEYSYELSQRFDLMSGVNQQDGGIMLGMDTTPVAAAMNIKLENGVNSDFVRSYLTLRCPNWFTPFSAQLCADFIVNNYQLDTVKDDKERLLLLLRFLSEAFFDAGMVNQLEQHSRGDKSTYAYYFTELIPTKNIFWQIPEWARVGPDHADELTFLFGGIYYKEANHPLWNELLAKDPLMTTLISGATEEANKPLIRTMMRMWSNFAKTGNPNQPMASSEETPEWPEYNSESSLLLDINSKNMHVRTTPNKERLEKIITHIFSARKLQFAADFPFDQGTADQTTQGYSKTAHEEL